MHTLKLTELQRAVESGVSQVKGLPSHSFPTLRVRGSPEARVFGHSGPRQFWKAVVRSEDGLRGLSACPRFLSDLRFLTVAELRRAGSCPVTLPLPPR